MWVHFMKGLLHLIKTGSVARTQVPTLLHQLQESKYDIQNEETMHCIPPDNDWSKGNLHS